MNELLHNNTCAAPSSATLLDTREQRGKTHRPAKSVQRVCSVIGVDLTRRGCACHCPNLRTLNVLLAASTAIDDAGFSPSRLYYTAIPSLREGFPI
jgi:hypothetical protein